MKCYISNQELNNILADIDIQIATVLNVNVFKAMNIEQSDSDTDEFTLALAKMLKKYSEAIKLT